MFRNCLKKRELLKYVGDFSQLFGIKDYTLNGGKAQGVRALDVKNGSGLEFTLLPDRCMDIAWLSYKGTNLCYISKAGIVSPQYYNENGAGFLRSFAAGFLTTCGLRNVGIPCVDEGESLGLHGRIANTPGEDICSGVEWIDDTPVMRVKGRMREARLFAENLALERQITCRYGENSITIEDTVENLGFRKEPLMLLYHFNLGYPLLSENSSFIAPVLEVKPRDKEAEKGTGEYNVFQKPAPGYNEQVFFHDLKTDIRGNTCAALVNEGIELGIVIRFNKNELFNLAQWKQMGQGDYVLGVEPCNCYGGGREGARRTGHLEYLEPGEVRKFKITAEILDGIAAINKLKDEISKI